MNASTVLQRHNMVEWHGNSEMWEGQFIEVTESAT